MGGRSDVGSSTRGTDEPSRGPSAKTRPYRNPKTVKPEDDPVIFAQRDRRKKELQIQKQRTIMSGASGAVLHKMLELKDLDHEVKALADGVQEYQDQVDLMEDRKRDLRKIVVREEAWCANFNKLIGPFEAKYEESKADVKVSYDHAKVKYKESLQMLIDEFGYHPVGAPARAPARAAASVPQPAPPPRCAPTHMPCRCLRRPSSAGLTSSERSAGDGARVASLAAAPPVFCRAAQVRCCMCIRVY